MSANTRVSRAALVFAATVAICVTTGVQAEYRLPPSPDETAIARDMCANVMRIRQGFVPFDACVESLSQTLKEKNSNLTASGKTPGSYETGRPQKTSYSESNPEERRP